MVKLLHDYALGVSYTKVREIENNFAYAIATNCRENGGLFCPNNLNTGIFTVAALDNLDHNPSSTTATSSFHGTVISLFQFPSEQNPGTKQNALTINTNGTPRGSKESLLPSVYTFVPPVGRTLSLKPPVSNQVFPYDESTDPCIDKEKYFEQCWIDEVKACLNHPEGNSKETKVTWPAFYAARDDGVGQADICIEALLPLFKDKSATPEMIKHGMGLVK